MIGVIYFAIKFNQWLTNVLTLWFNGFHQLSAANEPTEQEPHMNAPAKLTHFASPFGEPVTGELLCSDFQMTDTLQICLYGELPDFETGYEVTGITVPGSTINIIDLFSGKQLDAMGEWLDHKDVMGELPQRIAANAKHEAMRIKF